MKRFSSFLICAFFMGCFSCFKASAQDNEKNVIKINPLSLALGNFTLFYERQISPQTTAQLCFNYMPQPLKVQGVTFDCIGIMPEFRIYLSTSRYDAPKGGYVAPWLRYRKENITLTEHVKEASFPIGINIGAEQYAYGFVLGYQWITENGWSFDFFAGPFSNTNKVYTPAGQLQHPDLGPLGNDGAGFRIGIGAGYAF